MIFNLLINPILYLLNLLLQVFPSTNPQSLTDFTNNLSNFKSLLAQANWIFPVSTFFVFLSLIVVIETTYFTFKLVKWLSQTFSLGLIR